MLPHVSCAGAKRIGNHQNHGASTIGNRADPSRENQVTNPDWNTATEHQKLEMLRDDIRRIFDAVNALGYDLRKTITKLNEVSTVVGALKDQSPRAPAKKK